jgi:hypothetical protein
MTPHQHLSALPDELTKHTAQANGTPKGQRFLKHLTTRIKMLLNPPPFSDKQRVNEVCQHEARKAEQRVIDKSPIITLPCITDSILIMQTRNPTANWALKTTPQLHQRITRNNRPGILPAPGVINPVPPVATIAP